MNNAVPDPQSPICQALLGLALTLPFGPWLTVAGLRVFRDPSCVEAKSFVNWVIRRNATHGPFRKGDIRFWACMALLAGVGMDFLAVLMLLALIGAIVKSIFR